jgi:hypothetical protein
LGSTGTGRGSTGGGSSGSTGGGSSGGTSGGGPTVPGPPASPILKITGHSGAQLFLLSSWFDAPANGSTIIRYVVTLSGTNNYYNQIKIDGNSTGNVTVSCGTVCTAPLTFTANVHAENGVGAGPDATATASFSPPSVSVSCDQTYVQNSSPDIHCTATVTNATSVDWYRDGVHMATGSGPATFSCPVQMDDSMVIQVTASNTQADVSKTWGVTCQYVAP